MSTAPSSSSAPASSLQIDFVSDVSCPWCAIGLASLTEALARLKGTLDASLHFQPFELNPQMPPGGQDIGEHLAQKYGIGPEQIAQNREAIRARGAALGVVFNMDQRSRIYNTFDAHRLLHWAAELDEPDGGARQLALKRALLQAYFAEGADPSNADVLVRAAEAAGLDGERARAIVASEVYAAEVREREQHYQGLGIHSVPSVIVNGRHLIQGGQPPEVFEQALRQIAAA